MKKFTKIKHLAVLMLCFILTSCEDYLEIEAPDDKMISQTVFSNRETAVSAMQGIYNQLASVFFSSGGPDSVTVLAGLSADELTPIRTNNLPYVEFDQHEILPDNFRNYNLWSSAYNIIYMSNSLLEGLENSKNIPQEVKNRLAGEASFVRAFTYFYLVNLYGQVPLVLTTDYNLNSLADCDSEEVVYDSILTDLESAMNLLEEHSIAGDRTHISYNTVVAFLARVQLYRENWEAAEDLSSHIINEAGTYEILENLDQVFLANSKEAIWQLSPEGRGSISTNTQEGGIFIIHPFLSFLSNIKLEDDFVTAFETQDLRLLEWIGYHQGLEAYYPYKYKIRNSTEDGSEYSMVLRLAEQYLIRAEARALQDDLGEAIKDLDVIRKRAGLESVIDVYPDINKEELLLLILQERERELFTEWGHRWLDLKRTGRAGDVLGADNPLWQETDVLYPIPEQERITNPNLCQNGGY